MKEKETVTDLNNDYSELLSTDPLEDMIREDLGEEYLTDLWFYEFATSCLDAFGSPTAQRGCLDIEDEIYYTYCSSALVLALKEFQQEWENLRNEEPDSAAYIFAEYFRGRKGIPLIPPYLYSGIATGKEEYEPAD